MPPRKKLIVMLKYPRAGAVKTRLIPALGPERACELYRALVRQTLLEVDEFVRLSGVLVEVRLAGAPVSLAQQWLGPARDIRLQAEGDLGVRMAGAISDAFAENAEAVVIIGADSPGLAARHLQGAFEQLESHEAVIGPAVDGGYYLLGLRRFEPAFFRGIAWSTAQVFAQTIAVADQSAIRYALLDPLADVDRPEDLDMWAQMPAARLAGRNGISVVIAAYNEAAALPETLASVRRGSPHQVIVADGGSSDRTVDVAREAGAIVLEGARGRGVQMNRGAAVATGDYLLFLHADTVLPEGYGDEIRTMLQKSGVSGGAFGFGIADDFAGRQWVERVTNWRSHRCESPYGDQALFVRREQFERVGGFPPLPLMEDYVFVRRLRRHGRVETALKVARTSGRRWRRLGVVRTTLINQAIVLGYHCGISPDRLAGWYRGRTAATDTRSSRQERI